LDAFAPPVTYPSVSVPQQTVTAEGAAITGGAVGTVLGAVLAFGYMIMTNRTKNIEPKIADEEMVAVEEDHAAEKDLPHPPEDDHEPTNE
jgi:hypothetical protein